jgi:hypothetical protein
MYPEADADPDPSSLIIEGTYTSFFKDKKSKRSHKTIEVKVFLPIFA